MLERKFEIYLGVDLLRDSEAKKNPNALNTITFLKTLMRKICSKRAKVLHQRLVLRQLVESFFAGSGERRKRK